MSANICSLTALIFASALLPRVAAQVSAKTASALVYDPPGGYIASSIITTGLSLSVADGYSDPTFSESSWAYAVSSSVLSIDTFASSETATSGVSTYRPTEIVTITTALNAYPTVAMPSISYGDSTSSRDYSVTITVSQSSLYGSSSETSPHTSTTSSQGNFETSSSELVTGSSSLDLSSFYQTSDASNIDGTVPTNSFLQTTNWPGRSASTSSIQTSMQGSSISSREGIPAVPSLTIVPITSSLGYSASSLSKESVASTITSALPCAQQCGVNVTGTLLSYPGHVSTVTVSHPTQRVDVYIYGDAPHGNSTLSVTTSLPIPSSRFQPPLTWHFESALRLTWPTTYVWYNDFSYTQVRTEDDACVTAAGSLNLPSPTALASVVFPAALITNPTEPPSALVGWLNDLPTVKEQLSGVPIRSSCDPIVRGTTTLPSMTDAPVQYLTTVTSLYKDTVTHRVTKISSSHAESFTSSLTETTSVADQPVTTSAIQRPHTSTTRSDSPSHLPSIPHAPSRHDASSRLTTMSRETPSSSIADNVTYLTTTGTTTAAKPPVADADQSEVPLAPSIGVTTHLITSDSSSRVSTSATSVSPSSGLTIAASTGLPTSATADNNDPHASLTTGLITTSEHFGSRTVLVPIAVGSPTSAEQVETPVADSTIDKSNTLSASKSMSTPAASFSGSTALVTAEPYLPGADAVTDSYYSSQLFVQPSLVRPGPESGSAVYTDTIIEANGSAYPQSSTIDSDLGMVWSSTSLPDAIHSSALYETPAFDSSASATGKTSLQTLDRPLAQPSQSTTLVESSSALSTVPSPEVAMLIGSSILWLPLVGSLSFWF
ncbi:hypothetical protein E8E12_000489 [Didymella heteroderae]|uniref:Uncharacterized protein n=1 Tax=Didymella heteroderae TaxID=1769908 RepID=A0A9P4WFL8_9PLEO|nr:hypothetical protein E8E12_000489 [Didymella heteroderae]